MQSQYRHKASQREEEDVAEFQHFLTLEPRLQINKLFLLLQNKDRADQQHRSIQAWINAGVIAVLVFTVPTAWWCYTTLSLPTV